MSDASRKDSRVLDDAFTSSHYLYSSDSHLLVEDIVEQPVCHRRSWVGPQMATWRITGYVADSEGEDEDLNAIPFHSKANQLNTKDGSQKALHDELTFSSHGSASSKQLAKPTFIRSSQGTPDAGISSNIQQAVNEPLSRPQLEQRSNDSQAPLPESIGNIKSAQIPETTEGRLGEAIAHDRFLAEDVLTEPQNNPSNDTADSESPLSTPPDSPVLPPDRDLPHFEETTATSLPVTTVHGASRTFRPRKAIQINPYLLDFAKHQKDWGERGLKPVHIPRVSPSEPRRHEQESQASASHDDSQASAEFAQESMDLDEVEETQGVPSSNPTDEDLPDLDVFLREDISRYQHRPRQKTRMRKSIDRTPRQSDIYELLPSDEDIHTGSRNNALGEDSFPSPPSSISNSPIYGARRGLSSSKPSPVMPTPATSTDFRFRKRHIVEDDSQSQSDLDIAHLHQSPIRDDNESSDTGLEENDVRRMQQKVKGVLPASWWTVEKAQKELTRKRNEAVRTVTKSAQGPGVAQRKQTTTPHRTSVDMTLANWYEELESNDEESRGNTPTTSAGPFGVVDELQGRSPVKQRAKESFEAFETTEDDGFDPMLPMRQRTKIPKPKRRKIDHSIGTSRSRRRRRYHREDSTRSAVPLPNQAKQSNSRNIVHVLDAPGLSPEFTSKPAWLRIAARQAKRSSTSGTSVSRKFFQLESRVETLAILDNVGTSKRVQDYKRHDYVPEPATTKTCKQPGQRRVSEPSNVSHDSGNGEFFLLHSPEPRNFDVGALQPRQHEQVDPPRREATSLSGLNRLLSLLPVRNRAGKGRFAHKHQEPRVAQVEELRQDYRELSHRALTGPSVVTAQPGIPTYRDQQKLALIDHTESQHTSDIVPALEPTPQRQAKGPRPRRKQTPTHRSKLQQTLLVPPSPNTAKLQRLIGQTGAAVATVLEQEFVAHQSEWFQGRRNGIICANEATQRHFRVFLEVLEAYLSASIYGLKDAQDLRSLRSFLYRLVPNRGSIGAQGQVGDKSLDVLEFDIVVARNVFDLHVCLLNLVPAYAPLPRVLETKVNFADAHNEICLIALSAWQALRDHHHNQQAIIDGLSNWLHLILTQLISRWKSAESDARADAERATRVVEEQTVRKVIEHNRKQACKLLIIAFDGMRHGIEYATGLAEATSLLNTSRYLEVLSATTKILDIDERVTVCIFQVASDYAEYAWLSLDASSIIPILTGLRQAITTLTSSKPSISFALQLSMMKAFFHTARISVSKDQKSWHSFFEPTSSFSVNMFVSSKHLDVAKALVYHFLLEHEASSYFIDFRADVLGHWLRVVSQVQNDESCTLLTAGVLKREKESLDLPSLVAKYFPPESHIPLATIRENLPEIRRATLLHVIAELSGQENNAEGDWVVGGLEESDAVRLLKIIFTSMKETWMSLSEQPEEQDTYTIFVHTMLDQYEVHSRSDFSVDTWFFNTAMFPQRRKYSLAKIFTERSLSDTEFLRDAADVMQQEVLHAKRFYRIDNLADELKVILLPRIPETAIPCEEYTPILTKHALFIKTILPTFVESNTTEQHDVSAMILDVLIYVASNIECRTDFGNQSTIDPFAEALTTILSTVQSSLSYYNGSDRARVYTLALLAFELSTSTRNGPSERFLNDIARICDFAAQEASEDALLLLQSVMSKI